MAIDNPIFFAGWDANVVSCCHYHRQYFLRLQQAPKYYMAMYEKLLALAARSVAPKSIENANLLDFGCGLGLLGITAAKQGWGHVCFVDRGAHEMESAKKLSQKAGATQTQFSLGDENILATLQPKPDVLIAMDVIEHIYDLAAFLQITRKAMPNAVLLFTTGVVEGNLIKAPAIKKIQKQDEEVATTEHELKGKSFKEIRKEMIKQHSSNLSAENIEMLASLTRGKRKEDIERAVQNFEQTGGLPKPPEHATNTCNPYNGSWTEQLLTLKQWKNIFANAGYLLKVHTGSYNDADKGFAKNLAAKTINAIVHFTGRQQLAGYLVFEALPGH